MLFTGRQTRWDILTWDVLTETFWLPAFWLRTFSLGTFWLWDILTLGRFDLGCFDFGTFWLGTFWLWDVLTWDILILGCFDLGRFDFGTFWPVCLRKMFAFLSLVKYSENILGTFWLTKNGMFWQITWDVLTRYLPIPLVWNVQTAELTVILGYKYTHWHSHTW